MTIAEFSASRLRQVREARLPRRAARLSSAGR